MELNNSQKWRLRLYISGKTERNLKAISTLKQICDQHLSEKYEIEIEMGKYWR